MMHVGIGLHGLQRDGLKKLLQEASERGDFTLSSGKKSDWYLDCRLVTTAQLGLGWTASCLLTAFHELHANTLAGPATAAVAMMAAAAVHASGPAKFAYTRAKTKDHGTEQKVEGQPLTKHDRVLLVDDVLTSGGSLIRCYDTLREAYPEAEIVGAWILVDREEGGTDALLKAGIPKVLSEFTKSELLGRTGL